MDLEVYRRSAETFLERLEREYYRHYAGLKDCLEIEPIYSGHRELFAPSAVDGLRELRERAAPGSEERHRLRMLLDFAVQGYLGDNTKAVESELARREAGLAIDVDGEKLGFRASTVAQANEPDAGRRAQIEHGRLELIDAELRPLQEELFGRRHAGALELGWASYRGLCADCKALDLEALHAQTDAFLARTSEPYGELLEAELRSILGLTFEQLRSSDLPRLFRAPALDDPFPAERLVASFAETLSGLGIQLASRDGVTLDIERRPNKSPRAFCAPVRTPGEVYLVIAPSGGRDDFEALLHEGGHAAHAAHVDPVLPFEFRCLGDNAITETYAFLFQHLLDDPRWLELHLGVRDASALLAYSRPKRLLYLRRHAAKLSYELELHSAVGARSLDGLGRRYSELLGSALRLGWPAETFLADVDPGFYCACYLRAWALETRLRAHLRERFGTDWFRSPEAGKVLRELWREGQRSTPEELFEQLTGEQFDFGVLVEDLAL
jgi:hypothetical protein